MNWIAIKLIRISETIIEAFQVFKNGNFVAPIFFA